MAAFRERVVPSPCFLAFMRPHGCTTAGRGNHPCARLPVSMRPHGCTTAGRGNHPCARLPVSMRPHGCPRPRDGAILCPAWLHPWSPMAVRVARSDAPFPCKRTPIMPHGCPHHVGWVRASGRCGHRWSLMGASFPSTRVPFRPMRTSMHGKGWSRPRDGRADERDGSPQPWPRYAQADDARAHAGSWIRAYRSMDGSMPGAGQAMSGKGARVGLLGVRIVGIGDRQAGQGVLGCEGNDVRHDPGRT